MNWSPRSAVCRRGQDLARLSKADVPLPTLGPRLKSAYEDVRSGRGFTLLRGLPTDGLTLEEFTAAVYTIGLYFGRTPHRTRRARW